MALDKTTKRRLEKLIEYMATLPKSANKHFSMREFCYHPGDTHTHGIKAGQLVTPDKLHACGTTACALGWGTAIRSFRRAGLHMKALVWEDRSVVTDLYFGKKRIFPDDLGDFLKLDRFQGDELFGTHNEDESPRAWARRARKLVKQWSNASTD